MSKKSTSQKEKKGSSKIKSGGFTLQKSKENSDKSNFISGKSSEQLIADDKKKIRSKPYPIVAIGASAGGLEAVMQLLKNLSPELGMAYVYIQHLDPTHESLLSTILSKVTKMPVLEAEEKMRIQPDHLFIIPPNKDMEIIDGVLTLNPRPARPNLHMPINRFFMSLAEKQKDGAIGIVLSGSASDGTLGLRAIKSAGGITFAQDESAKFQSMPKSAVAEGAVDLVLAPDKIAKELERLSKNTEAFRSIAVDEDKEEPVLKDAEAELGSILQLLRKSTGMDFSNYKKTTIHRRIERRMLLHRLKTVKEYLQYLKEHAAEMTTLFNDLLINVTSFFRDAELCDYLKSNVLPKIIKEKKSDDPIRIWVPGCSSGQEAYSVAILLIESLGNNHKNIPVQVFASDLSENAIAKARNGIYSKSEVADVSAARLQRFFNKEDNSYRIVKSVRDLCIFAAHNVFKDPPFSRVDLVSCCNLLIYLNNELQKKALAVFHYALNTDGILVLGKTETVGAAASLFTPLQKDLRIFQRKTNGHARAAFETGRRSREIDFGSKHIYQQAEKEYVPDLEKTVDNLLLNRYIPACVVVNEDLEILQFRGSTGLFLEPSPGKASLNLIKMAREGLGFELRNAIYKVIKTEKPFRKSGIEMKNKTVSHSVSIEVALLKSNNGTKNFLILFEEDKVLHVPAKGKGKDERVQQLEQELIAAREDMGAIIEEREAMNEELQSANEEVVSSNEELQSINEELETSKEEIESTNEELQTINQELQTRNDQLGEAFNFADAIFTTMREALLVLDADLRIIRANSTFYKMFNTKEEETEKRFIFELGNRQWDIPQLRTLLEEIIPKDNEFFGFEVNHVFPGIGEKMMILNARKVEQPAMNEQLILLAIEDITEHIAAQRILKEREVWFRDMANNAPVMIWTSDVAGNRTFFNKTWLEYSGRTLEQEKGFGWMESMHPADRILFLKIYNEAIKKGESYKAEYRLKRSDGEYRWMASSAKPFYDNRKKCIGFIGTVTEIHDQRMINEELEARVQRRTEALQQANRSLEHSNNELKQFAYVASHDLQEPLRKIRTLSGRVQKKFEDNNMADVKLYLNKIDNSSKRMSLLIDDLLDFSRSIRIEKEFTKVDLNQTLKYALKDFDVLINKMNAKINVGTLPVMEAIPLQMHQLVTNIIGNALKFSENSHRAVIDIKSRDLEPNDVPGNLPAADSRKYFELTISDNGIGFDPEFAESIFVIFQRLHDKQTFPGTGIGLALCKKIVMNHGGEISASSEEGKGATFHIILPYRQN